MAGRPVSVRGRGLTGLHYGLFAFVFLTVASLAGFIFQLTRVKNADDRATSAERRLDKYGTPTGKVFGYYENEATARSQTGRTVSVFQVALEDRNKMADLIGGMSEAVAPGLEDQANTLLGQIAESKPGVVNKGDALLTAIRKLDESLTREIGTSRSLTADLADRQQKVDSLTQQLKSERDTFEQQVNQLKTQYQQAEEDFSKKLQDKETQLADLQATLNASEEKVQQLKREGDQEKREMQVRLDRQERQIGDLEKQIQGLKGSFDAEAILQKADGRVLRAIPGSDVVYVNLGRKNNIKVGMTFEVYSQMPTAGPRTIRGKASIEVATLMEDSAECRVTRSTPGQPIIEGDIIVNIAFEQGRKPRFVVRGDFDLNFDGQIDFDGMDRIAAIIRQWGGQVVPDLDESVDYVVIGMAPRAGEVPPGASDVVRDQIERKQVEASQFRKLIDQARSMYIPVVTQNQFLFLTGYAGDVSVRER